MLRMIRCSSLCGASLERKKHEKKGGRKRGKGEKRDGIAALAAEIHLTLICSFRWTGETDELKKKRGKEGKRRRKKSNSSAWLLPTIIIA